MYFMTTTMATVGYGDYNAAKYPEYDPGDNMLLMMCIQFLSIFTFTIIKDSMLSLVFDIKLSDVVADIIGNAQDFIHELDNIMKRQFDNKRNENRTGVRMRLDDKYYEAAMTAIDTQARHSCYDVFYKEPFYM